MDLWKKKFIIIWSGQLFSILSSAIVGYSVMFWLSIETKSAEVLSYAVLATLLPQALLGPIAGVYVDRWKRKLAPWAGRRYGDTASAPCRTGPPRP